MTVEVELDPDNNLMPVLKCVSSGSEIVKSYMDSKPDHERFEEISLAVHD